jgi:hypothetical protein
LNQETVLWGAHDCAKKGRKMQQFACTNGHQRGKYSAIVMFLAMPSLIVITC